MSTGFPVSSTSLFPLFSVARLVPLDPHVFPEDLIYAALVAASARSKKLQHVLIEP